MTHCSRQFQREQKRQPRSAISRKAPPQNAEFPSEAKGVRSNRRALTQRRPCVDGRRLAPSLIFSIARYSFAFSASSETSRGLLVTLYAGRVPFPPARSLCNELLSMPTERAAPTRERVRAAFSGGGRKKSRSEFQYLGARREVRFSLRDRKGRKNGSEDASAPRLPAMHELRAGNFHSFRSRPAGMPESLLDLSLSRSLSLFLPICLPPTRLKNVRLLLRKCFAYSRLPARYKGPPGGRHRVLSQNIFFVFFKDGTGAGDLLAPTYANRTSPTCLVPSTLLGHRFQNGKIL